MKGRQVSTEGRRRNGPGAARNWF